MTRAASDHLLSLDDGWSMWRCMRLRGAGFPAELVDGLAMPSAAKAIDAYLDADAAAAAARERAAAACAGAFERTRSRDVARALRQLRSGKVPAIVDAEVSQVLADARRAADEVASQRSALEIAFEADRRTAASALRRALASDRLREAITWQNRHALRNGLARLVGVPVDATDNDTRKRELAVASYLQRYCVKNDTISFFGPIAWGVVGDATRVTPGPALLAKRTVYYEHWCMNAIAQHLAEDAQILPWLRPRIAPTLRVDGTTLHAPNQQRDVSPGIARLLEACDGERTAAAIAAELGDDEDEVYAVLAALAEDELVTWTFELPPEELDPERLLRAMVATVGDSTVRERALAKLDAIAASRARVAAAAGDPDALDSALAGFEQTFTAITGAAATRKPGETYGGRTLLYEDCRRDVGFTLGADVVRRIAPPLALVLASARWYTHAIASRYRDAIRAIYETARRETGSAVVELRRIWDSIRGLFGANTSIVTEATRELQARWSSLLRLDGAARIDRSHAELRAGVATAFAAPGPGWPLARYQSPDLLIAAADLDAIAREDYLVVVGEVHTGINSVLVPVFAKEYPDLESLIRAREADIPFPCIAPVWSHERSRADMFSLARHDVALENGKTRSWRPRAQVIPESALVIEERDGRIEVRTRDGIHRFDVIAFLEHHLVAASHAEFVILGSMPHAPRVTIDKLVVSRERWRFDAGEVAFARLASPVERMIAARRWVREMAMPRRVFVKVPEETKPVYVDFESSIFVDNLARLVRKATVVAISEMLPDVDQTWLVDAEHRRYTSELRIVTVDGESYT